MIDRSTVTTEQSPTLEAATLTTCGDPITAARAAEAAEAIAAVAALVSGDVAVADLTEPFDPTWKVNR